MTELSTEERTIIFYESPYRIVKLLTQIAEIFGNERECAVCREISKLHEEIVRGSVEEVLAHFSTHEPKGEFVVVVAGAN